MNRTRRIKSQVQRVLRYTRTNTTATEAHRKVIRAKQSSANHRIGQCNRCAVALIFAVVLCFLSRALCCSRVLCFATALRCAAGVFLGTILSCSTLFFMLYSSSLCCSPMAIVATLVFIVYLLLLLDHCHHLALSSFAHTHRMMLLGYRSSHFSTIPFVHPKYYRNNAVRGWLARAGGGCP